MSHPSTESRSLSRTRLPIFGTIALVVVVLSYAGVRSFFSKPRYEPYVFWIPIADCDDSTGLPQLLTENATIEELESALGSRVIIEGVAEIKKRNKERSYVVGKHFQVRVPELDGEPSIDELSLRDVSARYIRLQDQSGRSSTRRRIKVTGPSWKRGTFIS